MKAYIANLGALLALLAIGAVAGLAVEIAANNAPATPYASDTP